MSDLFPSRYIFRSDFDGFLSLVNPESRSIILPIDNVIEQSMDEPLRKNPVPDDIIDGLPVVKITRNYIDESCIICTENFSLDEDSISLPCNHLYHERCIKEWFKRQNTCPICRLKISDSDDLSNSDSDELPNLSEDESEDSDSDVLPNLSEVESEDSDSDVLPNLWEDEREVPISDSSNLSMDELEEEISDSSNFPMNLSDLEFLLEILNLIFSQHEHELQSSDSDESLEDERERLHRRRSMYSQVFSLYDRPVINVLEQIMMSPPRENPVPDDIIEGLPIVKITQNFVDEFCIICTENFSLGEDALSLPCSHMYHERCIKEWFKRQDMCPICRLKITDSDEPSNLSEDEREEPIIDSEDNLPDLEYEAMSNLRVTHPPHISIFDSYLRSHVRRIFHLDNSILQMGDTTQISYPIQTIQDSMDTSDLESFEDGFLDVLFSE